MILRISIALAASWLAATGIALAKLPPPSDEAKAKAAEAAARTAHGNKVADYKLCQSMERVAAKYIADAKKAGKDVKPAETPPCVDPGPYVQAAPAATAAPAASPAPAPAAPAAATPAPATTAAPAAPPAPAPAAPAGTAAPAPAGAASAKAS